MRVVCVPVLEDNFSYLLIDDHDEAAAVDPAEPEKVGLPSVPIFPLERRLFLFEYGS